MNSLRPLAKMVLNKRKGLWEKCATLALHMQHVWLNSSWSGLSTVQYLFLVKFQESPSILHAKAWLLKKAVSKSRLTKNIYWTTSAKSFWHFSNTTCNVSYCSPKLRTVVLYAVKPMQFSKEVMSRFDHFHSTTTTPMESLVASTLCTLMRLAFGLKHSLSYDMTLLSSEYVVTWWNPCHDHLKVTFILKGIFRGYVYLI